MTQSTDVTASRPSKVATVAGWILGILPALLLLFSASMALVKSPEAVKGMMQHGYQERFILVLGIVELACTLLYLFPRTAVLGAILLTGYLGGATATHVIKGERQFVMPIVGSSGFCVGSA